MNQQAVKVLSQHREHWNRLLTENICSKEEGLQTVEALDVVIKLLEQEPLEIEAAELQKAYNKGFEDCRQAVLEKQYRIDDSATLSTRDVVNVEDIEDLQPVNPQEPKDGQIYKQYSDKWITNTYTDDITCPFCREVLKRNYFNNYCSNCGANMVELTKSDSHESEE